MSTVSSSDADIALAAQRLASGLLVSFPTETVYGLGANALDAAAAARIFEVKSRPPTDPLIVHVVDSAMTETLWDIDASTKAVALALAPLWPAPLTLVAKAAACVPDVVTGGSGAVGIRIPDHDVAQRLIKAAGVPVAAPSANVFGHVSPTRAEHVAADLAARDATLTIVDGGSCSVGIESTVAKLVDGAHIEILRRGFVTEDDLATALAKAGVTAAITVRDTRSVANRPSVGEAMDGPGQLLTHYAPCVPAFLVTPDVLREVRGAWSVVVDGTSVPKESAVVIDFAEHLAPASAGALATRSLSSTGNESEACAAVFEALRWTETVVGARVVLLPLVTTFEPSADPHRLAVLEAVEDRLFRAASGRVAAVRREQ